MANINMGQISQKSVLQHLDNIDLSEENIKKIAGYLQKFKKYAKLIYKFIKSHKK